MRTRHSRTFVCVLLAALWASGPVQAAEPEAKAPPAAAEQKTQKQPDESLSPEDKAAREALKQRISVDFTDTPLLDTVAFLREVAKLKIVLFPASVSKEVEPVTLKLTDTPIEAVLRLMLRFNDMDFAVTEGVIVVARQDALAKLCKDIKACEVNEAARAAKDLAPDDKAVYENLDKPAEVDFTDTPLPDVLAFFRETRRVNVVVDRAAVKGAPPLTIKVKDLSFRSVLKLILSFNGLSFTVEDGAIVIGRRDKLAKPDEAKPPEAGTRKDGK